MMALNHAVLVAASKNFNKTFCSNLWLKNLEKHLHTTADLNFDLHPQSLQVLPKNTSPAGWGGTYL